MSNSEEERDRLLILSRRVVWLRLVDKLGALSTALWLVWTAFERNIPTGCTALVALVFVSKYGPAAVFVVSTLLLSVYFHAVGVWLPVAAVVVAGPLLYVDIRLARAS